MFYVCFNVMLPQNYYFSERREKEKLNRKCAHCTHAFTTQMSDGRKLKTFSSTHACIYAFKVKHCVHRVLRQEAARNA